MKSLVHHFARLPDSTRVLRASRALAAPSFSLPSARSIIIIICWWSMHIQNGQKSSNIFFTLTANIITQVRQFILCYTRTPFFQNHSISHATTYHTPTSLMLNGEHSVTPLSYIAEVHAKQAKQILQHDQHTSSCNFQESQYYH